MERLIVPNKIPKPQHLKPSELARQRPFPMELTRWKAFDESYRFRKLQEEVSPLRIANCKKSKCLEKVIEHMQH